MCNSTITNGNLSHRTRLMDAQHAASFAKAISANSRFTAAEVVESTRAKPSNDERYFVSYAPASEAAQQRMHDEQYLQRLERARAEEFTFTWNAELGLYDCKSPSGNTYHCSPSVCDCWDFQTRGEVIGCCKHTIACLNALEDGLLGEEEALEMARDEMPCEACGALTTERVRGEIEEGVSCGVAFCNACAERGEEEAEEAMLPTRPVTREERRKRDSAYFDELFADSYTDWLK